MKCVCGYERLEKWQSDNDEQVGDEEFIDIIIENDCLLRRIKRDYRPDDFYEPSIYACPKCGTLKIDV